MSAYVIADVQLTGDADEVEQYRANVQATLEPYGGRFLVRGGAYEVIEGDWQPGRIVVLEFPSVEAAHAWNHAGARRSCREAGPRRTDPSTRRRAGRPSTTASPPTTGDTGAGS